MTTFCLCCQVDKGPELLGIFTKLGLKRVDSKDTSNSAVSDVTAACSWQIHASQLRKSVLTLAICERPHADDMLQHDL
jgi:hypothetical protein